MGKKKNSKPAADNVRKILTYLVYAGYALIVLISHKLLGIGICLIGTRRKNDLEAKAGVAVALAIFGLGFLTGLTRHEQTMENLTQAFTVLSWIYILARLAMTYPAEIEQIRNSLR